MESGKRNMFLGGLAIRERMVAADKVQEALIYQNKLKKLGKKQYRLGEILAMKKYLTVDQVKVLLRIQKQNQKKSIRVKQKEVQRSRLKKKSAVIRKKKITDRVETELDLSAAIAAARPVKAIDKRSVRKPRYKSNYNLKKAVEGVDPRSISRDIIVWVITAVISAIAIGYIL